MAQQADIILSDQEDEEEKAINKKQKREMRHKRNELQKVFSSHILTLRKHENRRWENSPTSAKMCT